MRNNTYAWLMNACQEKSHSVQSIDSMKPAVCLVSTLLWHGMSLNSLNVTGVFTSRQTGWK